MDSDTLLLILISVLAFLLGAFLFWYYLNKRIKSLEKEKEKLGLEHSSSIAKSELLQNDLDQTDRKLELLNTEKVRVETQLAEERARHESDIQRMQELREEIDSISKKMKEDFELISRRIMDKNAESFANMSKENMNTLLSPFSEKLKSFEGIVRETYEKGMRERTDLLAQVRQLHETNKQLGEEAQNLTRALKGDAKVRGNWGELVLERVLESSGLRKGEEYETQESLHNDDSERYQPDVIIHLPEQKHLIIDSKVSLVAYENYLSEEDEQEREAFLKQHILSVRKHINDLSEKGYPYLEGLDAPEFVMMFIPIEASFSLTIQTDADLFQEAWMKKIVIVSPSTLLATLRTIASIWRHEKQTRNAILIAKEGGALIDKLQSTFKSIQQLDKQIATVTKTNQDIITKFDGRGGLLSKAVKMQELGAKAKKELPKGEHPEDADDEE